MGVLFDSVLIFPERLAEDESMRRLHWRVALLFALDFLVGAQGPIGLVFLLSLLIRGFNHII